jgi:hypothetical protein
MSRRSAVLSLFAATVLTVGISSVPAYASPGTVISDIATPAAGQVTVRVTSDAQYVRVYLNSPDGQNDADVLPVPADTHTVDFTMSTWGLAGAATASVVVCTGLDFDSCGGPEDTASFTALDVTPSVTWPDISKLGTANGPFTVTVSDPNGGGDLVARWDPADSFPVQTHLDRNGTTDLDLSEGEGDITVARCSANSCHQYTDITHHLVVHRQFGGTVEVTPQFVGPDDTTDPDVTARIHVGSATDLTADLVVRRVSDNAVVPGFGGTTTGLVPDANGYVTVPVDLTGLTSGAYELGGTIGYDDPDFGHLEGPLSGGGFAVDSSKPVIGSVTVSAPTIYPVADGYVDQVELHTTATDNNPVKSRYEIRDHNGDTVRVLTTDLSWNDNQAVWNGRAGGGAVVPEGTYSIHTVVTDQYGNSSTDDSAIVKVSHQKLVTRTFTKTVGAKASLANQRVGRCSTLRFPSARGWKGSMGLYTGTKCRGSVKATLVSTVHVLRVPDALRYGSFSVSAYGGAAKANPRSLAYIAYAHKKKSWQMDKVMGTRVGSHSGARVAGAGYVWPDRSVAWGVYTAMGAQYDVKSFTVHLTYTVLH